MTILQYFPRHVKERAQSCDVHRYRTVLQKGTKPRTLCDCGSVPSHCCNLHHGRVRRHHNMCVESAHARSQCNGLCMVARRVCDDRFYLITHTSPINHRENGRISKSAHICMPKHRVCVRACECVCVCVCVRHVQKSSVRMWRAAFSEYVPSGDSSDTHERIHAQLVPLHRVAELH